MAAGGMVMGVLSEGEGGRGVPGVDSGLWMPFSQPGGERDRERKREKEGSKLGSAQLKRTSRLRLVAVLKKASAASNWVQVAVRPGSCCSRQSSQHPMDFLDFLQLRVTQIIVNYKKAKLRLSYLEKD
jgi:hypothetical protein